MQKETLLLVLGLAGVTGWIYREPIMNRINPPPPAPVTTADLAPADSVYKHSGEQGGTSGSGIYSWKDKDGKMHFGSRAESGDARAVTLSKGNTVSLGGGHEAAAEPARHSAPARNTYVPPNKEAEEKLHGAAMKQQAELGAMDEINR